MGGERMAKRSIASLVRKKLSDITNSQAQPKLHTHAEKPLDTFPSDKNCIEHLLKERATLMQLLAERDKIIELSGAELLRLRANVQKLQLQNLNLAQSNNQMLAELNLGRERIKSLQHEILCKAAILGKNFEVGGKVKMNYENIGSLSKQRVVKAGQPLSKASNDEKLCSKNRRRTKRSRPTGSCTASTKDASEEKVEIRPRSLRRHCGSIKTNEYEHSENSFETVENAKTNVTKTGPNLLSSRTTEDETGENSALSKDALRYSFGKPLRKTMKVQPCKEIPLKVKLRRLE